MDLFGFSTWPSVSGETFDRLRQEVDDLYQRRGLLAGAGLRNQLYPPVNLFETEDGYVLTAEVPGVRPEDLQVSMEGNRVTLRGARKIEYPDDGRTSLHRRERQSGSFRRTLELPLAIDAEKAEAIYRHGALMLRLPKAPEYRPRQIAVTRSEGESS